MVGRNVDRPISATDIVRAAQIGLMSLLASRFVALRVVDCDGFFPASVAAQASKRALMMENLLTCWPGHDFLWSWTNF